MNKGSILKRFLYFLLAFLITFLLTYLNTPFIILYKSNITFFTDNFKHLFTLNEKTE